MNKKTYAFDIDGVICKTENSDYENSVPNIKAIEKINYLHNKGHNIIIFTARFMGRTNNNIKKANEIGYDFTLKQLKKWNVKFDRLFMGKPSYDIFIDDRAYNYNNDWIKKL
jgi:capsule biosynthesis phosphatase